MEAKIIHWHSAEKTDQAAEFGNIFLEHLFHEGVVHQALVNYMAHARAGTQAQKTKGEVRGGGKKPWRQKGTGRARAGSIRSPLWRGGGKVFAAQPRQHGGKLNRKVYRLAMLSLLSWLCQNDRCWVVDSLTLDLPKTQEFKSRIQKLGLDQALLVDTQIDFNVELACRNLIGFKTLSISELNPYDLARYGCMVVTEKALKQLQEIYS